MRRHHNVESDINEPSAAEELQKTLELLLPIRRQRLSRSERLLREHKRALDAAEQRTVREAEALQVQTIHYQEIRDAFSPRYCQQRHQQHVVIKALEHEQQESAKVDTQQQQLVHSQQQEQQQQLEVSQAQQNALRCQRDLEKLEYLLQENGGQL